MAVSYVSQVYRSDPYVLPLDLNLLGRVLSVKQERFDRNAQSIQQGINQLGNTDILKSQDKEYLNGKINKLVADMNNFGGVDLSDMNISNQLSSMGSDIYNDPAVINAISGTKSVRALQSGYQAYKTNPKLSKLYSTANEYNDMKGVESYLADPNVGASYNGTSSPTPYVPYKDNLIKNINGIKANLRQSFTPNGELMYINEKNEEVTPERIVQMAKDLSTADEVAQMGRDGLYQFRNLAPLDVVNKAIDLQNQKITNATATLQRYNSLYLQATDDPIAKQNYKLLIDRQQAEINALQSVNGEDLINSYKQNPEEFTKNTYMDEFYRGLGSRFAYSRTERSISPNYAAIANLKLQQAERFHEEEMNLAYFKEGVKMVNGQLKKVNNQGYTTEFSTLPPNTQDPDSIPTGEAALNLKNTDLTNQNTQIVSDFLSSWANANPDIRKVLQSSQSPSGQVTTVQGYQSLENNNNQPGLQIEDLNLSQGSANYNRAIQAGLTPEQLRIYNELYLSYDQIATGVDRGVKDLPSGLVDVVERKQLNDAAILANNLKIREINKTLASAHNISEVELDAYNTVQDLQKRGLQSQQDVIKFYEKNYGILESFFTRMNFGSSDKLTPQASNYLKNPTNLKNYLSAKNKINKTSFEQDKADLYGQIENRVQFEQPILKDNSQASKLFGEILYSQGSADNSTAAQEVLSKAENIDIVRAGRSQDGTGYTMTANVTSTDGKEIGQYTVRLTPQQALQLGFNQSPYSPINDEVNIQGFSSPKLISAQVNPNIPNRTPLRAKIVVYRINPNSNTDFSSGAYIVGENDQKIAYIPGTKRNRPDESYVAAKGAIQTSENAGFTREQMINFFIQNKNK